MKQNLKKYLEQLKVKSPEISIKLSQNLSLMADAIIEISTLIKQAPFIDNESFVSEINVQGEMTQWLDVKSNQLILNKFSNNGSCAMLVSEEDEDPVISTVKEGEFLLAFDPLDGSSNLGVNIPVGTIFAIWHRKDSKVDPKSDEYFVPGNSLIAAGYSVYGPNTELVLTCGDAPALFVLNCVSKEFELIENGISVPEIGSIYSINEGNSSLWNDQTKNFIEKCKEMGSILNGPLSARYVGSMVADLHRNIKKGGIFIYPADSKNPKGKLRMLYECIPMAYIVDKAGGMATNGTDPILNIVPSSIHERSPLVIGSKEMVSQY